MYVKYDTNAKLCARWVTDEGGVDMDVVVVGSVVMFMPVLRVSCNQVTCHIMLSPNSETLAAIERCWFGSDYTFLWTDGRNRTRTEMLLHFCHD